MLLLWNVASECRASLPTCSGPAPSCCRRWQCLLSFSSRRPDSRTSRGRFLACGSRQYSDCLDLQQCALAREAGDCNCGAGRPVGIRKIAVANLAEEGQVLGIYEVVVEFHHVAKLGADRVQSRFEVLESLDRLQAKVAAELAAEISAELACHVDDPSWRGDFHHMGIAR